MTTNFKYGFVTFRNSQIFVSICGALMGAESYLIAGVKPDWIVLTAIFFATLFIYNASRINLDITERDEKNNISLKLTGGNLHVTLSVISVIVVFILMTAPGFKQVLIFIITALLSLAYMMPFSRNSVRMKGLRNNIVLKNIVLSFTWAAATVLFPLESILHFPFGDGIIFLFLRRFFFIYALTIVFDIRDIKSDAAHGMKTMAVIYGVNRTKIWSVFNLGLFFLFTIFDPFLHRDGMQPVNLALCISGLITAFIILGTDNKRNASYYAFIIDGAMVLQFLLVAYFTHSL